MPVDPTAIAVLSRLDERMASLSGGQQQIDAASPEEKLRVILNETSDTILPRVLSFAVGNNAVRLLVANARILKADTEDEPLVWVKKPDDVAQSLKNLTAADGAISITPESLMEDIVSDGAGVPGRDVLSYCQESGWFEEKNPAQEVPADQTFEDVLFNLSDATATLIADGVLENISGQDDLLPPPELLQELQREFDEVRTADEAWLILPVFGQNGHATGMYLCEGKTLVHVTASEDMSDVAAAWAAHLQQNSVSGAPDRGDH